MDQYAYQFGPTAITLSQLNATVLTMEPLVRSEQTTADSRDRSTRISPTELDVPTHDLSYAAFAPHQAPVQKVQ